jgi:hypothetical protein
MNKEPSPRRLRANIRLLYRSSCPHGPSTLCCFQCTPHPSFPWSASHLNWLHMVGGICTNSMSRLTRTPVCGCLLGSPHPSLYSVVQKPLHSILRRNAECLQSFVCAWAWHSSRFCGCWKYASPCPPAWRLILSTLSRTLTGGSNVMSSAGQTGVQSAKSDINPWNFMLVLLNS